LKKKGRGENIKGIFKYEGKKYIQIVKKTAKKCMRSKFWQYQMEGLKFVFRGKGNMVLSDPWLPILKQAPTEIS
jgi:hypothetical protein